MAGDGDIGDGDGDGDGDMSVLVVAAVYFVWVCADEWRAKARAQ